MKKSKDVIIFSVEDDHTTSKVMQWIKHYSGNVKRFNEAESKISISKFKYFSKKNSFSDTLIIEIAGESIELLKDKISIWFRRGMLKLEDKNLNVSDLLIENMDVISHLNDEYKNLKLGIYNHLFTSFNCYSIPYNYQVNKIASLNKARSLGLKIPETLITNNKSDLISFINKYPTIITKGIQEVVSFNHLSKSTTTYTIKIEEKDLPKLPGHYFKN